MSSKTVRTINNNEAKKVFEQSPLATETGAAIHLAPNSNGILKRLGIIAEQYGANPMEKMTEYTATGEVTRRIDLNEPNKRWQHVSILPVSQCTEMRYEIAKSGRAKIEMTLALAMAASTSC